MKYFKYIRKTKKIFLPLLKLVAIALVCNPQILLADQLGKGYEFDGNGKRKFPCEQPLYQTVNLPTTLWEGLKSAQDAASHELKVIQKDWQNTDYAISAKTLKQTLLWLQRGAVDDQTIIATLIHGEDGCTNTHFTGYFTPVLDVKTDPDEHFRFPLYRLPEKWPSGKKLTRRQIDIDKDLDNQGLELGYSASLLDNYFVHVQGSVKVRYVDTGKQIMLAYGGKNGFSYKSLGRYLVENGYISAKEISLNSIRRFFDKHPDKLSSLLSINDSYTFFRPVNEGPFASSGAQVTAFATAAVDKKYIPYGAVLLAEIPQINQEGNIVGYQWRLLMAQDSGAAIKGPGHVDIYMGTGELAKEKASALHHYGRLYWLRIES
jgi:peptidoglycan lytic transglycosylase A